MTALVRLYPRAWRDRYEAEFLALLESRPPTPRDRFDLVRGAVDARLHPEVPGSGAGAEARRRVPVAVALAAVAGVAWLAWLGLGLAEFRGWDGPMPSNAATVAVLGVVASLALTGAHVAVVMAAGDRLRPVGALAVSIAAVCFLGVAVGAGILGNLALLASGVVALGLGRGTLPSWLCIGWAAAAVASLASMVAFLASSGREVWMLGFMVLYGLVWLAISATLAIRGAPQATVGDPPAPGPTSERT